MAENRMNLAALQQRDPYITKIVDTASQVAFYSFSSEKNEWEKTDVEGTLFVYTRSARPTNGFLILNRLGLEDLIEPINRHLEFQLQEPFLLYRNTEGAIFGIWFYDKTECMRLGQLMNRLVEITFGPSAATHTDVKIHQTIMAENEPKHVPVPKLPTGGQVNILEMLSKAQHEYDKSKDAATSKVEPKPMIDNPNATSTKQTQIIKPLARKLGDEPIKETNAASISLDTLFQRASQQHRAEQGKSHVTSQDTVKGKINELSTMPGQVFSSMVQDRSVISADDPVLGGFIKDNRPSTGSHGMAENPTKDSQNQTLQSDSNVFRHTLGFLPISSRPPEPNLVSSAPIDVSAQLRLLNINCPQPTVRQQEEGLSPYQDSALRTEAKDLSQSSQVLLTPEVFLTHLTGDKSLTPQSEPAKIECSALETPEGTVKNQRLPSSLFSSSVSQPLQPLTEQQMKQALIHLIQTDSSFIRMLHKAYIDSLTKEMS